MNIILQHYDGKLGELEELSKYNMECYARDVGAEYHLIKGMPFDSSIKSQCQKVHMIHQDFDSYNEVLMVDIDMFVPKEISENVFDWPGIGMYEPIQQGLHRGMVRSRPGELDLANIDAPYWGGAIYKMDRITRQRLRSALEAVNFQHPGWRNNHPHVDEGIFHTLAYKAGFKVKEPKMFIDQRWCWCSYLPNPEKALMMHIRNKSTPQGDRKPKIENYKNLVARGIL